MSTLTPTSLSPSPYPSPSSLLRLPDLPDDVTHQILDMLSPADIAAYVQLCQSSARAARDPSVWASAARRHLAVASSTASSAPALLTLARSLRCHWSVATGLFVTGVPVHRRSGFVVVRYRGGIEIALKQDLPDSCYVFGGRYAHRAVPAQTPALSMDFVLEAHGPFPVAGLQCRIVHAAEPMHKEDEEEDDDDDDDQNQNIDDDDVMVSKHLEKSFDDHIHEQVQVSVAVTKTIVQAHIIVKINEQCIHTETITPGTKFSTLNIIIPPDVLVTKPALNTLSIEYERESTAGYWLRDVAIAPTILPLPQLSSSVFDFPLASRKKHTRHNGSSSSSSTISKPGPGSSSNTHFSGMYQNVNQNNNSTVQQEQKEEQEQECQIVMGIGNGVKVTPFLLEQLGDNQGDMSLSSIYNNNHNTPGSPSSGFSSVSSSAKRKGKVHNAGKRPKHLHHKQNYHHRTPRGVSGRMHR